VPPDEMARRAAELDAEQGVTSDTG
jgi:hypothetical protein